MESDEALARKLPIDYLTPMRLRRNHRETIAVLPSIITGNEQGSSPALSRNQPKISSVTEVKNPSQQREIMESLRAQIDLIERQTMRKEKLLRVQAPRMDFGSSVEANEEINLMYLQAIEQKLAFLNNI